MRLLCCATRSASRAVKFCLIPYFLYLVFYGCATTTVSSNIVSRHTCPPLQQSIYPLWFAYVQPKVEWADKKLHVSATIGEKLHPLKVALQTYDDQYKVTHTAVLWYTNVAQTAANIYTITADTMSPYLYRFVAETRRQYRKNCHPLVLYYGAKYKYALETSVDSFCEIVKENTWKGLSYAERSICRAYSRFICPLFTTVLDKLSEIPYFSKFVLSVRNFYGVLREHSSLISLSLQRKKDFVRSEFYNFVDSNKYAGRYIRNREEMNTIVTHLLEDITDLSFATGILQNADEILQEIVSETSSTLESSSTDTLESLSTLEPLATEESGTDLDFSEYSDEDDTPITYTQTHTVFVTEDLTDSESATASESSETDLHVYQPEKADEEMVTFGRDSSQTQIEYELSYWQAKVQKTLDLAVQNLETDFSPFLNAKIDSLKEAISANFSTVQQDNYKRYKEMGMLIVSINKDAEHIRATNTTIDEPEVDRQIMRDKIAEAYAVPEEMLKYAEDNLNEAHVEVLTQYYKVCQDTVDVLESFAETAISDFSSRLSALLEMLQNNEDFDDAMSWSAWKSFHKVKESLFEIRDQIFDEANAYKFNARGTKIPRGLEPWAEYLGKVNFHIGFLLRDNAEYLQLVRAKANVAYQEREGLTYHLKQQEEREKKEREERELQVKAQEEARTQEEANATEESRVQEETGGREELEQNLPEAAQREDAQTPEEAHIATSIEKNSTKDRVSHEQNVTEQKGQQISFDDVLSEKPTETPEIPVETSETAPEVDQSSSISSSSEDPAQEAPVSTIFTDFPTESVILEKVSTSSDEPLADIKTRASEVPKPEVSSPIGSILEENIENMVAPREAVEEHHLEAGEQSEAVEEAGQNMEMSGERGPAKDEL